MITPKTSEVSIVIPVFNEEKNIEDVLLRTNAVMETLEVPYEIIVVDDGSTDKTRWLASKHKVTLLINGTNQGKGYALRKGLRSANGNILVTMDGDGSHRPEDIQDLLTPLLNGADIVIGSRFTGKREKGAIKRLHILGNHLFNLLILFLTGKRITDSQSGFRAYRREVMEKIKIISRGYEVETELIVKALKNGFVVQEKPIACEKRKAGHTKLNPVSDGFKILKTILRIYACS
jgi:glycosyltransferase involved in cell wall biosynthesis